MKPPPERLSAPSIVLRRWRVTDAPLLLDAIVASLPELQQWTPWVIPEPLDVRVLEERLRKFEEQFDTGETYIYGIFDATENKVLGQVGLYARVGPDALEIGYFMRSDATGRGIATVATALLVKAAFEAMGVPRLEVRCEPGNLASIAIPRRLGFHLRETIEEPNKNGEGSHSLMIWELRAQAAVREPPATF